MRQRITILLLLVTAPLALGHDPGDGPVSFTTAAAMGGEAYDVTTSTELDGEWRAANPAQGLTASFTPGSFEVSGRDRLGSPWNLRLELSSWGRGGSLNRVDPGTVTGRGRRVEIQRNGLTEWYLNGEGGIEQGFDIAKPPAGEPGSGPLTLTLVIGGGFTAHVLPGKRDARFVDADGDLAIGYTGLRAWDSTGRELGVSLAGTSDRLSIRVEDREARYPVTIDPMLWVEEAKLRPSAGANPYRFGESVSVSGHTALVGEPNLGGPGKAYIFVRVGTSWDTQALLHPLDGESGDRFGTSVALSGDTALIGAVEDDDGGDGSGSAYVFVRSGSSWSQQAKLTASDAAAGDSFGKSVSIQGDTALVGAFEDDSGGTDDGSAYVFVRSGTSWSQQAELIGSDSYVFDWFGHSVSLSGDTALIGTPRYGHNDLGVAYVFERSGTTWAQQQILIPAAGIIGDYIGYSVALAGDTAVLGAPYDTYNGANAGVAYVFTRSGSSWSEETFLRAEDCGGGDEFGSSIAISGHTVLIGAHLQGGYAAQTGAAYVFTKTGAIWSQEAKLGASDPDVSDYFGCSVSIDGDVAVAGAWGSDGLGYNDGAAYVFTRTDILGTGYCFGDPGSGTACPCDNDNDGSIPGSGCDNGVYASGARLSGEGTASVGSDTVVLTAMNAEPYNSGLFFQGDNRVGGGDGVVFGDGLRCAGGAVVRLQVRFANDVGTAQTTIGLGAKGGVVAGETKRYQYWYRTTANPPCGLWVNDFNLTNGYEILWAL